MSLGSIQLTPINLRGTPTNTGTGTGTGTERESESGTGFSNNDNTSSERTPTNSGQLDNNGHFRVESSNRWGAIPEEDSSESQIGDSFNLRSSAEASKRLETIRNDMIQNARITFEELKLDVEEPVRQINHKWDYRTLYIYLYIFIWYSSLCRLASIWVAARATAAVRMVSSWLQLLSSASASLSSSSLSSSSGCLCEWITRTLSHSFGWARLWHLNCSRCSCCCCE